MRLDTRTGSDVAFLVTYEPVQDAELAWRGVGDRRHVVKALWRDVRSSARYLTWSVLGASRSSPGEGVTIRSIEAPSRRA
jgi:hypothetical protein